MEAEQELIYFEGKRERCSAYKAAGVDIEAAAEAKRKIAALARTTFSPLVISEIGSFGSMIELELDKYERPVFVSSVDGVGTKLKLATLWGRHNTVGLDLVAHCVNDILVQGATPLFFMDYIASSKLDPQITAEIVEGLAEGCKANECALIGGETAELPGVYSPDDYDLVGFIVGVVDKERIVDGQKIRVGDKLIGLASSGLHTNGYSLVRKLFLEVKRYPLEIYIDRLGRLLIEELMEPHRSYLGLIRALVQAVQVKGMAHITGGGMVGNIPRILPSGTGALIFKGSWSVPPIFSLLQEEGKVTEEEMYRVFNMGIGFVVVVSPQDAERAIEIITDERIEAHVIGEIVESSNRTIKIALL